MIVLRAISVALGGRPILSRVDATVREGEFVMVIGANGAGKTTLLDLIAGRTHVNSGSILIGNVDVTRLDERRRTAHIARLFQNPAVNVVSDLTVRENLLLAAKKGARVGLRVPSPRLPLVVEERLAECGSEFELLLDRPVHSLSGGQRQMVALVVATVHIPQILLLDEPTAALDPLAATKLLLFAKRLIEKHKITTIMVTHNQRLAVTMGTTLWVVAQGGIAQVYGEEKRGLAPEHLIGDINYAVLI